MIDAQEEIDKLAQAARDSNLEEHRIMPTINSGLRRGGSRDQGHTSAGGESESDDDKRPELPRSEQVRGSDPVPFEVYNLDGIDELSDPTPLIKDVLNRGCVAILFGEYGTAKSFVALDWSASLATGTDWFRHEVDGEHKILYIAAEGAQGLKKRKNAWQIGHGITIPVDNFHVVRVAVRFATDEDHYEHLWDHIQRTGYDLVVIDTLSRCTPGMDENGPDMAEFIERVFQLRDAHGIEDTAFVIVHHAGKDKTKGARGWSGLPAATDFSYVMQKWGDGRFALKTDRTKDAEPLSTMTFELDVIRVNRDGDTSCILKSDEHIVTEYEKDQTSREVVRQQSSDEDSPAEGMKNKMTRRQRKQAKNNYLKEERKSNGTWA